MNKKYVLGVDAGGTKTEAAVANVSGKVLGTGTSGVGNIKDLPPDEVSKNYKEAIKKALLNAELPLNTKFYSSCFGMADLDYPEDGKLAEEIVKEAWSNKNLGKIIMVNDLRIIFRSGTDKSYGAAVVSGTGSNYYGRKRSGKEYSPIPLVPKGTWKDAGSGGYIGKRVLETATKITDSTGTKTTLSGYVKEKFNLKNLDELEKLSLSRKEIALLATLADKAAEKGDKIAKEIIEEAVNALVIGIINVIKVLRMRNKEFEVVCGGGVFKLKYPIKSEVKRGVLEYAPKARVIFPKDRPVIGAVKMAIDIL